MDCWAFFKGMIRLSSRRCFEFIVSLMPTAVTHNINIFSVKSYFPAIHKKKKNCSETFFFSDRSNSWLVFPLCLLSILDFYFLNPSLPAGSLLLFNNAIVRACRHLIPRRLFIGNCK